MSVPLIEKYRPKTFDDLVGIDKLDTLKEYIKDPSTMPNILFHGPAGTGKTSATKVILDVLQPIDVLKVNGSDTTGVDTVRDRVFNFMSSMSTVSGKPKIVWIEEFDYMSANAFAALRSMIETYMKNARFICTCNYIHKIPEPIQSRFSMFNIEQTDYDAIELRLIDICEKEGIKHEMFGEFFKELITKNKGDMRSCINMIQQLSSNTEKELKAGLFKMIGQDVDIFYTHIIKKKWSGIRYGILKHVLDFDRLLVDLDDKFFNSELEIPQKIEINDIIAKGQFEMNFSFDKNICFSAICSRIMKVL